MIFIFFFQISALLLLLLLIIVWVLSLCVRVILKCMDLTMCCYIYKGKGLCVWSLCSLGRPKRQLWSMRERALPPEPPDKRLPLELHLHQFSNIITLYTINNSIDPFSTWPYSMRNGQGLFHVMRNYYIISYHTVSIVFLLGRFSLFSWMIWSYSSTILIVYLVNYILNQL